MKEDIDNEARRLRLEPEFASLFTNASFVRDPSYQKDMAELRRTVASLDGRNNRVNAKGDIPSHEGHGKHYCVGMAYDPFRTFIFENRMECDIQGWTTMASFCIPKEFTTGKHIFKVDGCVGVAHGPTRSMYFKGHKNCDRNGWTHAFEMPVQDAKGPVHFLRVWEAFEPHRMTVSSGGDDLTEKGWTLRTDIPAYTITYPMTPSGLKTIKPHLPKLISIHKRATGNNHMIRDPLRATIGNIIYRALQYLQYGLYHDGLGTEIQQFNAIEEVRRLLREYQEQSVDIRLVLSRRIPGGFENNLVVIELRAGRQLAAALMMDENIHYGESWIREGLSRSLMDREVYLLSRALDRDIGRYRGFLTRAVGLPSDIGIQ
ncbi:hypothetical protein BGW41_003264 [Actinomortierella wolfii]|nr:hypothetical protein BGW41_003264 [Actinomortierella wolfii]